LRVTEGEEPLPQIMVDSKAEGEVTTQPCLQQVEPILELKMSTWSAVHFKKHVTLMSSKLEPAI